MIDRHVDHKCHSHKDKARHIHPLPWTDNNHFQQSEHVPISIIALPPILHVTRECLQWWVPPLRRDFGTCTSWGLLCSRTVPHTRMSMGHSSTRARSHRRLSLVTLFSTLKSNCLWPWWCGFTNRKGMWSSPRRSAATMAIAKSGRPLIPIRRGMLQRVSKLLFGLWRWILLCTRNSKEYCIGEFLFLKQSPKSHHWCPCKCMLGLCRSPPSKIRVTSSQSILWSPA